MEGRGCKCRVISEMICNLVATNLSARIIVLLNAAEFLSWTLSSHIDTRR